MASAPWAVVVLHQPDPALLASQWEALREQVAAVVYVDNAGGHAAVAGLTRPPGVARVTEVGEGDNVGLAAGLNLGLAVAAAGGAERVLLLDQDSVPAPGMVAVLAGALSSAGPAAGGRPVAAVGPAIRDLLEDRTEYFVRFGLLRNRRIRPGTVEGPFAVDFLITSGTLLDVAALQSVGPMDDSLFIDSVDFEWSFRATSAGYALLATFATSLGHRRGDRVVPVAAGRNLRVHSPSRVYFMYRNRVRLYFRPYVPLAWKVHDLVRMVAKAGALLVLVPGRAAYASAVGRGVADGLRQRGRR